MHAGLLSAVLLLAPSPARAEEPAKTAETPPAQPAAGLRTPRKTMETFLNAVVAAKDGRAERMAEAVECLNLDRIDLLGRKDYGPKLAWMLLEVLDRTWKVDYEEIPDTAEGPAFRKELARDGRVFGELVIERDAGGAWRFGAEFVAGLPGMVKAMQDVRLLAGLTGSAGQDPGLWLRGRMPATLRDVSFLLEHWQWIGLLILIFLGIVFDRVVTFLLRLLLLRWMTRKQVSLEKGQVLRVERPAGLMLMSLTWCFGLNFLFLPPQTFSFLNAVASFLAAASGVWAAYNLVDVGCVYLATLAARTASKMDDLLIPLVRKTLKTFVVVVGIVFVAGNLGINITALLAGLGLGGIAFALAAKDTVENLFGSITVLLDRPFQIGDWVVIGEVEGTVEEVGFRSTRIRTFYNSLVTIPNSKLVNSSVDNYGARVKRRIRAMISVTYATPPETILAFCEGIRELIRRHPYTCKDAYHVYFNQFAASSLDILLYCFVRTPDWATELRERERLFVDIVRLAQKLGVDFAFPTQTLHIESQARPQEAPSREQPPADSAAALMLGKKEADALAARHLGPGGAPPPPVAFAPETADNKTGS
ncbi:MAG: mechanosensitive ion channel family protein [Planctomycetota bacterium]|nr:mechanosensitive ion channel family protein [Planctomycetota bacterium]